MHFKTLLLMTSLLLGLSSNAAIDGEQLIGAIKGRYILQTSEAEDIHFLIRSSGKLQIIGSDRYDQNFSNGNMTVQQGDNGLLRGMPVAHLIFSEGSDEQALDFHFLLTAEQDWDSKSLNIRLLSSFALENDGPNEVATVVADHLVLLKYNVRTKKFFQVK